MCTVPLTSNLTALACRARVAREYSNTHMRVLARVLEHARTHAQTRARDSRAVDTLASYPSPPLSFGVGRRWYRRYRYAFACTACARYLHAHVCDTHCTRVPANIHTRVARASHTCGFRVTCKWTRVDQQVARERHCTFTSLVAWVTVVKLMHMCYGLASPLRWECMHSHVV